MTILQSSEQLELDELSTYHMRRGFSVYKLYITFCISINFKAAEAFFKDKDRDMDGKISYDEFIGQVK